jgi:hypothetical protein
MSKTIQETETSSKSGYEALMHCVCGDWGFCGCVKNDKPLHVDDLIHETGLVTADQFVEWVFLADNMNPNSDIETWQKHKDAIRTAFISHMGSDVVDACRLKWSGV